jgi:hypothetical protein
MRRFVKSNRDRDSGFSVRSRVEACRDRLRRNHQTSRSEVIRKEGIVPVEELPNEHEKLNEPGQRTLRRGSSETRRPSLEIEDR